MNEFDFAGVAVGRDGVVPRLHSGGVRGHGRDGISHWPEVGVKDLLGLGFSSSESGPAQR